MNRLLAIVLALCSTLVVAGCQAETVGAFQAGSGIQHVSVPIPLATIQAQTSGAAFNVGSALPTNARFIGAEVTTTTPITGGTISAATATVQGGSDAAGSIIASTSVFTGGLGVFATTGSNPYRSRGGQQLKMTLTSTGDTLAHATAGVLALDYYYTVLP